jgi:hypothetical protein
MLVSMLRRSPVHPLLLDELASARVEELRCQARRERLALSLRRPSPLARATRRSLQRFGYVLVGAGLRLATAGEGRDRSGGGLA